MKQTKENYEQMVSRLFTHDFEPDPALTHIYMLLAGETIEILIAKTNENMMEEFGDVFFAAQAYCNYFMEDFKFKMSKKSLMESVEEVLNDLKRKIVYGTEIKFNPEIYNIIYYLCKQLERQNGMKVPTCMKLIKKANQNKLYKRFPKGFSKEAAINRADKEDEIISQPEV